MKINSEKIKICLKTYKNKNVYKKLGIIDLELRDCRYECALNLLEDIRNSEFKTTQDFLLKYEQLTKKWYSTGLLRGKTIFSLEFSRIVELINHIATNSNSNVIELFENGLQQIKNIKRFGVNALTEIMHTYNQNDFPVLNGRTVKTFFYFECKDFPRPYDFTVNTFKIYYDWIKELSDKCGFDNFGQVDHFITYTYDNYIKNKQI